MQRAKRWLVVVIFAAAMAWVESAVVFYLRTMVDRIEPHQPMPLPLETGLGRAELVREAATMIMLLAVGILAGRAWRSRLGYFAVAFGVWDIFYYVFLKVLCGWPHSLFDWDVLFLIPMPWWGPVLAPALIALLMVLWGTLQSGWRGDAGERRLVWSAWLLSAIGMGFALYTFMADNLRVARLGLDAWRNVLPTQFNWTLFCLGLLLMAAPLMEMLWRWRVASVSRRPKLDLDFWIEHFERNRRNRPQPAWPDHLELASSVLTPLRRSLAQFQLGDGGGPASLIARDAERFRSSSSRMRTVVDQWFAEEAEHSRLLGLAVDAVGAKRIRSHWSFSAFCACRRVLGVRFELQVLLLTEITSTCYYRLLQRHSPLEALADTCGLILRDEGGHVAFHRDRLAAAGRSPRGFLGALWSAQFRLCGYAAATMLWINHAPCICGLGGSTREFYSEVTLELRRFLCSLASRVPAGSLIPASGAQSGTWRAGRVPAS